MSKHKYEIVKRKAYVFNQADEPRIYEDYLGTYTVEIDGREIDTRNLSNDQYKRALTLGIKHMLVDGEVKLEDIGANK